MDTRLKDEGQKGYLQGYGNKLTAESLEDKALKQTTLTPQIIKKENNKLIETIKELTTELVTHQGIHGQNMLIYDPKKVNRDFNYNDSLERALVSTLTLNIILPHTDIWVTTSYENSNLLESLAKVVGKPLKYMHQGKIYENISINNKNKNNNISKYNYTSEITNLENKRILFIEEILLGIKDIERSVDTIRKNNGNVTHVLSIFDYNCEKSKKLFEEQEQQKYTQGKIQAPCKLYSIIKYEDAIKASQEAGNINKKIAEELVQTKNQLDDIFVHRDYNNDNTIIFR